MEDCTSGVRVKSSSNMRKRRDRLQITRMTSKVTTKTQESADVETRVKMNAVGVIQNSGKRKLSRPQQQHSLSSRDHRWRIRRTIRMLNVFKRRHGVRQKRVSYVISTNNTEVDVSSRRQSIRQSLTVEVLDYSSPKHDDQSSDGIFEEERVLSGTDSITSPVFSSIMPELQKEVIKLQRVGAGSSSSVFMAVHTRSLKLFSIKEVPLRRQAAEHMIRAEILALKYQQKSLINGKLADEKRASPFIVEYYGYSEDHERNVARIAVEFVGGGNMQDWITHKTPAPEPWLKSVIFQSLKALSALHKYGHHHLDVKPANILITQDGNVKLADFGLSASGSEGGMLGTRRFMSPERLSGHTPGPEADIWSLGVVLVSAALGQDFLGQAEEAFGQLLETDKIPEKLSEIEEGKRLSHDLLDFVSKCLVLHPDDRPRIYEFLCHPWLKGHDQWQKECKEEVLTKIESHRRTPWVDPNMVVEDIVSARKGMVKEQQSSAELTKLMPLTVQMIEPLSNELHVPASRLFDAIVANEKDLDSKWEERQKTQSFTCDELSRHQQSLLLYHQSSVSSHSSIGSESHDVMCSCDSSVSTATTLPSNSSSLSQHHNEGTIDPMIIARVMEMDFSLTRPFKFKLSRYKIFEYWKRNSRHRYFTGEDAVKWLIKMGYAKNETNALSIGNAMIEVGAVFHVRSEHVFENRTLLYKFRDKN